MSFRRKSEVYQLTLKKRHFLLRRLPSIERQSAGLDDGMMVRRGPFADMDGIVQSLLQRGILREDAACPNGARYYLAEAGMDTMRSLLARQSPDVTKLYPRICRQLGLLP